MVSLAAVALAAGLAAQTSVDAPTLRTIRLDAVVVDTRGQAVEDLDASEFEVLERGTPRVLESVRFAGADEGPRLFALFLDEYHLTPGASTDRARAAARRVVELLLEPRDLLAVLKPLDSLGGIELVSERDVAIDAIRAFDGRAGNYAPRNVFERSYIAGAPPRIDRARKQIVTSALNAVAAFLGKRSAARKSLIVISEGFSSPSGINRDGLPTLATVARSANASNVSIYVIDPRVLADVPAGPAARSGDGEPSLGDLAEVTGGFVMRTGSQLDSGLRRVADDVNAHYLLEFQVPAYPADGRFHPVQMRVTRPGAELRPRPGYYAFTESDLYRAPTGRASEPAGLPSRPPRRASRLIRPWFGLSRGPNGLMRVKIVWEPAGGVPGSVSRQPPPAQVSLRVFSSSGLSVFQGATRPWTTVPRVAGIMPAIAVFDVPVGQLSLEMSIEDADAAPIDVDVRDLVVRPLPGPVAIGSAEVLRTRTALEFETVWADADALPTPAREFSRSERLLVRAPAYGQSGVLQVRSRLLSRIGGIMRDVPVIAREGDVFQIDLPLAGLATGLYALEITATSDADQAVESVDFRVLP